MKARSWSDANGSPSRPEQGNSPAEKDEMCLEAENDHVPYGDRVPTYGKTLSLEFSSQ